MLYCNTVTVAATGRAGAGLGAQAHRRAQGARPGHWTRDLGAGRAAWALGAGPGRAGWPGLCTRCTPLGFQPGFSTWYFS